jgi:hypothetical protein
MTSEERASILWTALNECLAGDPDVTMATVTHWLEHHGADFPQVALMQETVRSDAKLWATSATQTELEAYTAAAVMELEASPITNKAAKRLAALGFNRMNAESKAKFREWVNK